MKRSLMLTIASLLSILFLTLHVTDDIVRGMDKAQPANLIALLVMAFWMYGLLVLPERRPWYVITLIGGIIAAGMPAIHLRGTGITNIVKSSGGHFFLWTLFVLGVLGGFCIIASVRGLLNPEWGQSK
jgi:ABC-type iron transport system FetAB permease component